MSSTVKTFVADPSLIVNSSGTYKKHLSIYISLSKRLSEFDTDMQNLNSALNRIKKTKTGFDKCTDFNYINKDYISTFMTLIKSIYWLIANIYYTTNDKAVMCNTITSVLNSVFNGSMAIEHFDTELENIMNYINNMYSTNNCKRILKLPTTQQIDITLRIILGVLGETKKLLLHLYQDYSDHEVINDHSCEPFGKLDCNNNIVQCDKINTPAYVLAYLNMSSLFKLP